MNLPFNNHIEKVFASFEWFHGLINGVIQRTIIANFDQGVFHFETYFFSNTAGLDLSCQQKNEWKIAEMYYSEQKLLTSSMNNRTFLSRPPPANSNPHGSFSFSRVKFTVTNSVSEGILKAEKCKELCSLWQKAKKYFFNQLKNYVKSNLSNLEGWWNYLWYNDNAKSPKKWCYSCPKSWLNRWSRSWVLSQ